MRTRKILCLTSSPRRDTAYSNLVAARVLKQLALVHPDALVVVRNLARNPLPHVDEDFVVATRSLAGPRTERQRALLERSDSLVDELLAADTIVIAAAMVNFTVPSTLKAWIDHVVRPGRTFRYTEAGSEGLLKGQRAILVLARGDIYAKGRMMLFEHQESYLRAILNFLGISDIRTILVEGVALGPEAAELALGRAMQRAAAVAGVLANSAEAEGRRDAPLPRYA